MKDDVRRGLVYVAMCSDESIKVVCKSEPFKDFLLANEFTFEPLPQFYEEVFGDVKGMYFVRRAINEDERVAVLDRLRNAGIPFSGGKAWSPQDVFEALRDSGKLNGTYLALDWMGDGAFELVVK
ncbi:hypothetical protein [Rhizobium halophytocola]|uniref:Uncharacterized protein n=1 Tax=Rhizobium halophytocola TaxID=735519 RepID=A0ABS4E6M4_9HYPH|nr:hypothetical protein [Rhizobium halophytocola]MBP1853590.1 hypothetical protein [Rhizobium halophytocola]